MKLGTFIKQSLLFFLVLSIAGSSTGLLKEYLGIERLADSGAREISWVFILYLPGLWGVYRAICEKYAELEDVPIFFLGILFVFSILLSLVITWFEVQAWIVFITSVIKSKSLLNAILVFQWILLDMVFIAMPWFVAVRSGQGLYNKRFRRP